MPRPIKKGLTYFPLDVDFFRDRKIKTLKGRFGVDGIILYLYILCEIYRENGYYLQLDEDFYDIAADELNFSSEKIGLILNFLLERSLFDDKLFKSDKVLTSHGIQMRFQEAVKKRRQLIEVGKFWVLKKNETESFINCTQFLDEYGINSDKYSINSDKYGIYDTKKSKEKKSKVNKSIICAVVAHLNGVAGANYREDTKQTVSLITARLNEGYTLEDFKTVIDKKAREWKGTDMEKYLRPETLFGNKFEGYVNGKSSTSGKFGKYSCKSEYDFDDIESRGLMKGEHK